jgi:predicted MFS family arabinose efflux permease
MSRPQQSLTYRAVLSLPGALRSFTAASLGRLAYGTIGLSLLLVVHQATHSFAAAGTASGVYAVGTLTGPVKSRFADRYGQRRILPLLGAGSAAAMIAMAVLDRAGDRSPAGYVVLAGLAGAAAPVLGAAMRALWAAIASGPDSLRRAYSLDAATEEVLFTLGPLLAGALVALNGPSLALAVTAVLLLTGSVALAVSPAAAAHPVADRRRHRWAGPLRRPGFPALLGVVLTTTLGLGAIDVTITARAVQAGDPAAAGYVLAALGLGSALGGLLWGKLSLRARTSTQMTWLLLVMTAGVAGSVITPDLLVLGVVMALAGTVIAPVFVLSYLSADRLNDQIGSSEATTWINTAANAGTAVGYGLTGLAVDSAGSAPPMLAGAAVLLGTIVIVMIFRNAYDQDAPHPQDAAVPQIAVDSASVIQSRLSTGLSAPATRTN